MNSTTPSSARARDWDFDRDCDSFAIAPSRRSTVRFVRLRFATNDRDGTKTSRWFARARGVRARDEINHSLREWVHGLFRDRDRAIPPVRSFAFVLDDARAKERIL